MSLAERREWYSAGKTPLAFTGGSILLVTLLFMLVLALLATAIVEGSALQLRMAGNHQGQEAALQQTRAVANEVSLDRGNYVLDSGIGSSNCAPENPDPDCDRRELGAIISAPVHSDVVVDYRTIRRDPLFRAGVPTREPQEKASSVRAASVALFEVDVKMLNSSSPGGLSQVVRGVAVRIANRD